MTVERKDIRELFDISRRLIEAATTHEHAAERAMSSLKTTAEAIDARVSGSLERATKQASTTLVGNLEGACKSADNASRRLLSASKSVHQSYALTIIASSVVAALLAFGLAYFFLSKEVDALRSERTSLINSVKRLHQLDIRLCGQLPCVKIDKGIAAYQGGFYTLADN